VAAWKGAVRVVGVSDFPHDYTCPARKALGPDEITPRQWWQYNDCGGGAGCVTLLLLEEQMAMLVADPMLAAVQVVRSGSCVLEPLRW
jgi:hypothetical protein